MSMKENVDYIKQELNSEEKFLENFVKVERFYKKHKKLIIAIAIIIVLAVVSFIVKQNIDQNNKIVANKAFDKILDNPKDKEALSVLKEKNKKLYEVALYLNTKDSGTKADINLPFLKQLLQYEEAVKTKNLSQLNTVSMESDFLLKEFAILNKAILLTNESKYEEAKNSLKLIPKSSKAYELANLLNHYLVTK